MKPANFYLKITERANTIQVTFVNFRSILSENKNKITMHYEISYFGFNIDRKLTKETWIVLARSVILKVKIGRFQNKQNVLNLKWTLKMTNNTKPTKFAFINVRFSKVS